MGNDARLHKKPVGLQCCFEGLNNLCRLKALRYTLQKYFMKWLPLVLLVLFAGCQVPRIAVDNGRWQASSSFDVKGRNLVLIRQKLSFGNYRTLFVRRSWKRGTTDWGLGLDAGPSSNWANRLQMDFVRRRQTVRFGLTDATNRQSQVTAFARVSSADLTIGNNPTSLVPIIGDLLQAGPAGSSIYAVRIVTAPDTAPWEMVIDNNAAQRSAGNWKGYLAQSRQHYYTLEPVAQLFGRNGAAVLLPFGGAVGYAFRNRAGAVVAAVSLIDRGRVYFGAVDADEQFLLANAMAALLLQEQLD